LAVEVAGQDEDERALREKAAWYLAHGVSVVWLVLPESREVLQLRSDGELRFGVGTALPANEALPGLTPAVPEFFSQLDDAAGE
jgi:Uma2 family endonuclease